VAWPRAWGVKTRIRLIERANASRHTLECNRRLKRFMTPLRSKSNLQNTAETPLVTALNPQRHSCRGGSAGHIVLGCERKSARGMRLFLFGVSIAGGSQPRNAADCSDQETGSPAWNRHWPSRTILTLRFLRAVLYVKEIQRLKRCRIRSTSWIRTEVNPAELPQS